MVESHIAIDMYIFYILSLQSAIIARPVPDCQAISAANIGRLFMYALCYLGMSYMEDVFEESIAEALQHLHICL